MKTIGMIGGLSWESSAEYYRILNEMVRERSGGLRSAKILLWSFDFAEIEQLQRSGLWDIATERMVDAALRLERAGADILVICSNTMHKMADEVQAALNIPLLHIADATAGRIATDGLRRVGLLGTRYTMEQDFYRGRLEARYGLEIIVPTAEDRAVVNQIIYEELVVGKVEKASKAEYVRVIAGLIERGAQGIILGCTEIMLLIQQSDCPVPIFDTTTLHVIAAVDAALSE